MPALDLEITELPSSRLPITRIDYRLDGGTALELPGGTAAGTRKLLLASTAAVAVQVRAVAGGRAGPWSVAKTAVPYDVPSGPEPEPGPQPEPGPEPLPQASTIYVDPSRAASGDGLAPATALKALPAGPFAAGTTIKVRGGTKLPAGIVMNSPASAGSPVVLDLNDARDWGTGPAIITGETPVGGSWTSSTINGNTAWTNAPPEAEQPVLFQGENPRFQPAQFPTPAILSQNGNFRGGDFWSLAASSVTATTVDVNGNPTAKQWLDAAHAIEPLTERAEMVLWQDRNLRATRRVQSYVNGIITLTSSFAPITGQSVTYFGIQNHPSALLVPGQMIWKDGTEVTILPFSGANPNSIEMTYPAIVPWGVRIERGHNHVRGGLFRRMRPNGLQDGATTGRRASAISIPHNASARVGCKVLRPQFEEVLSINTASTVPATIRIENWTDVLVEDAVLTDCSSYGIAMFDCINSFVLGAQIVRNGTTGVTARRLKGCGFIGCDIRDPNSVHGNCMSIYEGNEDCLFLFNNFRITNEGSNSPAFVTHALKNCMVAFNTSRHAADGGVTLSQHTPNGSYRPLEGDGPYNVWANNVALNGGKIAFNLRDTGNPGSTVINNIVDVLAYDRMPAGGDWVDIYASYDNADAAAQATYLRPRLRGFNVWTRNSNLGNSYPIGNAERAAMNEIVRSGTARTALFTDLAADDFRPASTELAQGLSWVFDHPLAVGMTPVAIDWIGRYRPDGSDAFDWRAVNWGGLK
jgi:hypothetical protein